MHQYTHCKKQSRMMNQTEKRRRSKSRHQLFCAVIAVSSLLPTCSHALIAPSSPSRLPTALFDSSMTSRTWRRREPQRQGNQPNQIVRKKTLPMPITGYNAKDILDCYDRRPLEVGWRLNSLGFPLLGWYFGLLSDKIFRIDTQESVQRKRGAQLRGHLVRSQSVALIKVRRSMWFSIRDMDHVYVLAVCAACFETSKNKKSN